MKNTWFTNFGLRTTDLIKHKLICFPYAGGTPQIFSKWKTKLTNSIEVIAVQLPGKGNRIFEPPFTSMSDLIEDLLPNLPDIIGDTPFSFFGHSLGAVISFELINIIQKRSLQLPMHFFLSASPAPWGKIKKKIYSTMSDEKFKDELKILNGTPPELLDDKEFLQLILPGLRADFSLSETYRYNSIEKLAVPTSVFYGEHDNIPFQDIEAWQQQIKYPLKYYKISGDHFFIHSHVNILMEVINETLLGNTKVVF